MHLNDLRVIAPVGVGGVDGIGQAVVHTFLHGPVPPLERLRIAFLHQFADLVTGQLFRRRPADAVLPAARCQDGGGCGEGSYRGRGCGRGQCPPIESLFSTHDSPSHKLWAGKYPDIPKQSMRSIPQRNTGCQFGHDQNTVRTVGWNSTTEFYPEKRNQVGRGQLDGRVSSGKAEPSRPWARRRAS